MKRIFAILILMLSPLVGMAQIGTASVTATGSFTLNAGDVLTLRAQIVGCGNGAVPYYNNLPISNTPNQTYAAPFTANASQVVTFTLPGNDKILCGNQTYTTYAVTWDDNGFPIAPTQTYRIVDGTTINLNQQVAINFIPPVIGNSAGSYCPTATPIFTGFNAQYVPQCAAAVSNLSAAYPITGGTLQGPATIEGNLALPYPYAFTTSLVNGIPQADQFPGADACAKLSAAIAAAHTAGVGYVDATHFTGTQACATNPFAGLTGDYNLFVMFGATVFNIQTPWTISASNISLQGQGPQHTQIIYVGSATQSEVVQFLSTEFVYMDGFFIAGGPVTVPTGSPAGVVGTGLFIQSTHRSSFSHLSVWGATVGISTSGAVTDTWLKDHVSNVDATWMLPNYGVSGYGYTTPGTGWFFSNNGGVQTTNGSVIDLAAEGNSTWGIQINSAQNMTFTGGTAEFNGAPGCTTGTCGGVLVGPAGKYTTWIGEDFESNGVFASGIYQNGYYGSDLYDDGQQNVWIDGIFGSIPCSGSCSTVAAAGSARGQSWIIGPVGILSSGGVPAAGDFNVLGSGSVGVQLNGPITSPTGNIATLLATNSSAAYFVGTSASATVASGTNVTATCADLAGTGNTCNSTRGTIKFVNSGATTTQVLATITFASALPLRPNCTLSQQGGAAYYAIYDGTATTTGFTMVNQISVSGSGNFYVTYNCQL